MLLFGIYFPTRLEVDREHPWAKWLLIGPLSLMIAAGTALDVGEVENFASVASLHRLMGGRLGTLITLLAFAAIGVFFACLGYKHGSETAPDARRRLRLLEVGAQVSLAPVGLLVLWGLIFHATSARLPPRWSISRCRSWRSSRSRSPTSSSSSGRSIYGSSSARASSMRWHATAS
jgi:hypothetical protein